MILFGRIQRLCLAWLLSVGVVSGALGQYGKEEPKARVRIVSESDALVPGTSAMLGLWFEIDEGWHVYQESQNDTGLAPQASWDSDGDLGFGAFSWPAGHRFVQPGEILDHGYEGLVLLMLPVDVPESLETGGTVRVTADVEWLTCDKERCVPGSGVVSLELPVRSHAEAGEDAGLFDEARRAMGTLLTGGREDDVSVSWEGTTMVVDSPRRASLTFVPGPGCASVEGLLENGTSETGQLRVPFEDLDGEVVGWVRLHGAGSIPLRSDVWLVRTRVGVEPAMVLNGRPGGG